MQQKPKAITYKVVIGYLLLFAIAVTSVWFVYTEILKIAAPSKEITDNKKILRVSKAIADLYASEALARKAMLTINKDDYIAYTRLLDSINIDVSYVEQTAEEAQRPKFDSIRFLINRKKNSVTEIYKFRKELSAKNLYSSAISGIFNTKDSIRSKVKPVRQTKKFQWDALVNSLLTPQQRDSLSKLPVSNDSLAMAFEKVLVKLQARDENLKYQLYAKEQKLLEENRIISDQLRAILSSLENDFIKNSYAKIATAQQTVSNTVKTMAWIGAATLLLLIIFAGLIIRDLGINQKYRKQLEVLNTENEQLLRSKSMLMATVTHDLQTPLGSIIGFQNLLVESGVSSKQQHYLTNIRESAGYIQNLVNDLMDFSKLENNRITIDQKPFNCKKLIESTCNALNHLAINKDIELSWDVDDSLDRNFISDPYRLRQILTNLVSNALKFTSEGSVEVSAWIQEGLIHISVLDTGIGIAKGRQDDVFLEFTQAHDGIEKKFGGTGLGLTISKRIIELLGGSISLESEEGQGSIFTIVIPAIATALEAEAHTQIKPAEKTTVPYKRILAVDDDPVQLVLIKELLANYPVSVATETNSTLVLKILEEDDYDIVLTDVQMPVMDGFELVSKIRAHYDDKINTLPVIALSGRRELSDEDFTAKGFTANHPKPVQIEQLIQLIAKNGNAGSTTFESEYESSYNLESLSKFTYNDKDALRNILTIFTTSSKENCASLSAAVEKKDADFLGAIAHKMIPMLKQLEANEIAAMLVPLEDGAHSMDWEELVDYVRNICDKMFSLIEKLEKESA
ncbi:ATP-binding protein [Flavobacterium sp. J372]|uniref:ATP-binding response regulator n=1 Tax=Flavobacterium sp. J372 TaxID=2898436 RepID=UPI0021514534|nr:ATP-binding protein [Flavobacterium sp. J372]MCR5861509.1 ATP-binding protein [Flavobacterium sp. J372]